MPDKDKNPSERLFSELCGRQYLKGFVFHSPKYNDPTEMEAGDVVLWVRDFLVTFEVVWRNPASSGSTKQFVKRIGEKRKQLLKDYQAYSEKGEKIKLTNEIGSVIPYDKDSFNDKTFCGVICSRLV